MSFYHHPRPYRFGYCPQKVSIKLDPRPNPLIDQLGKVKNNSWGILYSNQSPFSICFFYQYDIGQPLWIGYFLNEPATRSLSTSSSVAVLKLEIIQRAHDFIHKIRKKIISTQQLMRSRTKRTHEAISRTLHNY